MHFCAIYISYTMRITLLIKELCIIIAPVKTRKTAKNSRIALIL